MGSRILVSSAFTGPAILYGAKALMLYENLPVLAMLPVSSLLENGKGKADEKDLDLCLR
jgi:hypothetical protein